MTVPAAMPPRASSAGLAATSTLAAIVADASAGFSSRSADLPRWTTDSWGGATVNPGSKLPQFVLCLCDLTGTFAAPWVDAGYVAVLVDPQHPTGVTVDGSIVRIGHVIDHPVTWAFMRQIIGSVAFTAAFPPCTDLAVSGAAWFASKADKDPAFQHKAMAVVNQCRTVAEMMGAPYFIENPVSVMSTFWRKPDHTFSPCDYGGYIPADQAEHPTWPEYIAPFDAYPKKTCLWTGGGFVMPERKAVPCPPGYSDQHKKLGGKSERTKNIRSATPRGFSRAVFAANHAPWPDLFSHSPTSGQSGRDDHGRGAMAPVCGGEQAVSDCLNSPVVCGCATGHRGAV